MLKMKTSRSGLASARRTSERSMMLPR